MRPLVLLSLLFAASVSAADLRFGAERFLAPPKIGYRGQVVSSLKITVTPGDGQFLLTWVEFRPDYPASNELYGRATSALAMRVDMTGHPIDPHPIALPVWPRDVVWTGNEWIVVSHSAVRIDRNGRIVGPLVPLFDSSAILPDRMPSLWTGSALIVSVPSHYEHRLFTRTFDSQLNLVEEKVLVSDEDQGGYVAGIASDGASVMLVYRASRWANPTNTFGAMFTRDGHLLHSVLLPPYQVRYRSVVGSPAGYAVMGDDLSGAAKFRGVIVDSAGILRAEVPSVGAKVRWDLPVSLMWDGARFAFVYFQDTDTGAGVFATSFATNGATESARELKLPWSTERAWASLGSAVAAVSPGAGSLLETRVASDLSSIDDMAMNASAPSAEPREMPVAAVGANHVLVAWRQRPTATGLLDVYAARLDRDGNPIEQAAIHVGSSSCHGLPPAVASDGRDFLVAWRGNAFVQSAIVREGGTSETPKNVGRLTTCTKGGVSVASNGSQYLVTWSEPHPTTKRVTVYAARVATDGTVLDRTPLQLGETARVNVSSTTVKVASDGAGYLVVWEKFAVRVTSAGAILDKDKLLLGTGDADAIWFNGHTYVVATNDSNVYRFLRIGSDGSGAVKWNSPALETHLMPYSYATQALTPTCDASGCLAFWGDNQIVRIADDGQKFAVTTEKANIDHTPKSRTFVFGSRLMLIYARSVFEAPYSQTPAILVRTESAGRTRTVRH